MCCYAKAEIGARTLAHVPSLPALLASSCPALPPISILPHNSIQSIAGAGAVSAQRLEPHSPEEGCHIRPPACIGWASGLRRFHTATSPVYALHCGCSNGAPCAVQPFVVRSCQSTGPSSGKALPSDGIVRLLQNCFFNSTTAAGTAKLVGVQTHAVNRPSARPGYCHGPPERSYGQQ